MCMPINPYVVERAAARYAVEPGVSHAAPVLACLAAPAATTPAVETDTDSDADTAVDEIVNVASSAWIWLSSASTQKRQPRRRSVPAERHI